MALMKCTDCGREVSDAAPACPGCGRPISPVSAAAPAQKSESAKKSGGGCGVILVAFAWMSAICVVLIAVLLVFGSLVPESRPTSPPTRREADASRAGSPQSSGNRAHDLLLLQSDSDRNEVFSASLKLSGEKCESVERSFFQGLDKDMGALWSVACNSGESYSVLVNNDATGSTKILDCGVLKLVSGIECFKKF